MSNITGCLPVLGPSLRMCCDDTPVLTSHLAASPMCDCRGNSRTGLCHHCSMALGRGSGVLRAPVRVLRWPRDYLMRGLRRCWPLGMRQNESDNLVILSHSSLGGCWPSGVWAGAAYVLLCWSC